MTLLGGNEDFFLYRHLRRRPIVFILCEARVEPLERFVLPRAALHILLILPLALRERADYAVVGTIRASTALRLKFVHV